MAMGLRARMGPVVWYGRPRPVGHGILLGPALSMFKWTVWLFAGLLALCWWLLKLAYLSVWFSGVAVYRLIRQEKALQEESGRHQA